MAGFSFWKFCVHFWIACCIPVRSRQSQHDWVKTNMSSFENCNRTEAVVYGYNLTVSPSPIILHPDIHDNTVPPIIRVQGHVIVTRKIPSHESGTFELLNSFILSADNTTTELCQILPLDFCHVTDVCHILSEWMKLTFCPILFDNGSGPKGWNCKCLFEQGTYIMPRGAFPVNVFFPFRLHADFNIIAKIKENGVPLGCGSFKFSVRKATDPEVFNVT
ncbi:uncharacterized protein LOC127876117 [Dreissena polymorpha]|uniref:MD-2-related lipid-recognition domain-containing protein n=1 Tax=Dreissena polymorpha TaxID=45954 RepID=A0A9D4K857_DREPO|nr:uncharacterized protein LOC127876117 [Dreissena polymorpha]KAH3834709.1 hypothetical protein DPMN_108044 [Dreissena polymorpha]